MQNYRFYVQNGAKSAKNCPKRPKIGQNRPKLAKIAPKSAKIAQNWSKSPQNRLKSPEIAQKTAKIGQNGVKMVENAPKGGTHELSGGQFANCREGVRTVAKQCPLLYRDSCSPSDVISRSILEANTCETAYIQYVQNCSQSDVLWTLFRSGATGARAPSTGVTPRSGT